MVVDECLAFWIKTRIPIRGSHRCKEQLKKLYDIWKQLSKNKNKSCEVLKQKKVNIFGNSK